MPEENARADLIGFVLTHKVFRRELPRLVAAFAGAARDRPVSERVEDHLRLVLDQLSRHHQEEDEFHWPLLASRVPGAVALLDLLEAEHTQMDPLVALARDRDGDADDRAAHLARLTDLVLAHLDEEDRTVVPLLAEHITGPEQDASMRRGRERIPVSDELRVLALMLDAADDAERDRMLAPLPPEVVDVWRTLAAPGLAAVHDELTAAARR